MHGIPGDRVIKEGDIVSIDLGATYKGFVGDTRADGRRRRDHAGGAAPDRRDAGVALVRHPRRQGRRAPRRRLGAIGDYIESQGFGVVREYVGHGVGPPDARRAAGAELRPGGPRPRPASKGMVLALEPMVTIGDWHTKKHADGWTVSTLDGSLCAHFEHTIAITDGEAEVLTLP